MPQRSDGTLLREVEEWITSGESLLYIQMAFGLILDAQTLFMLGGKFGLIKKFGDLLLFNSQALDDTINRCYFPLAPKDHNTLEGILRKYPTLTRPKLQSWIEDRKVATRKVEFGVEDIIFIDEHGIKRLFNAMQAEKELKARSRRKNGKGKKCGKPRRDKGTKIYTNPVYKRDAEERGRRGKEANLD